MKINWETTALTTITLLMWFAVIYLSMLELTK